MSHQLHLENLEGREMLTAVTMTDYEQLLLEMVNRARQDPLAEVARNPLVGDLNEGLAPGTISTDAKQPLASVQELIDAGGAHALDMLENNYFSHYTQPGNATPTDRAAAQGYSGSVGENIAWSGSTGPIDELNASIGIHNNLFDSPAHRENIMVPGYEEVGTAIKFGQFHNGSNNFNAAMVAEEFGYNSGSSYLTGVAYNDSVIDDDFYSVGESEFGIRVTAVNTNTSVSYWTMTGPSGGYNVKLPAGNYTVTAYGGRLDEVVVVSDVVVGSINVKVDFDTSTSSQNAQDLVGFSSGGEFWVGESNRSTLDTKYYGEWSSATSYDHVGVGDFNGDGLDDIAARAASDGTLVVAISVGDSSFATGTWGSLATITTWSNILIGDFNGDGMDDLLGRADSDGTFWLAQSNGSSFTNSYWGKLTTTVAWTDLATGDFNGDGNADTVARAADGTWWASISNGEDILVNAYWGRWSNTVTWTDVSVGDFNGDGLDDVAGRANNADWWVNRSSGSNYFLINYWGSWTGTVTWEDVTVGDFDGDGRDDIGGRAGGQWWLAMSTGIRFINEYWGYWTTTTTWSDVSLIDINADGQDDLIGRASNGQWWALTSNGSNFNGVLVATWSPGATWMYVGVGNFI